MFVLAQFSAKEAKRKWGEFFRVNKRRLSAWFGVIIWMAFIFCLSHQPATVSDRLSTDVTELIIDVVEKVAPSVQVDRNHMPHFNHLLRKNAHFFSFLLLGALLTHALTAEGMKGRQCCCWAFLMALTYAVTDEVHQAFIPGRGAQVRDVLIDGAGAAVGVFLYTCIMGYSIKKSVNEPGS